ncbi:MAG: hypothetical protein H0T73_04385 [Ardenticatenales bacterium]|nr:hypothetical protein [Ardenticatenales bacterium]
MEEYHRSVRRHLIELRTEFGQVESRWHAFSAVYEGDAADQFRAHWLGTVERFREYIERTESIAAVLEERIEHLRAVNQTDSSLS